MSESHRPIGVFDSGVGGLTVVREIIKTLPHESLIYLGDTARVPYGTRSREVVIGFALQLAKFLLSKNVKALVVACNTISANALSEIRAISPVPVIDVVSPTIAQARRISKRGKIGVIATTSTINSGAYARVAKIAQACPLFVPLAEEGMADHPATDLLARGYLSGLADKHIDTLILGCTHFPILRSAIAKAIGNNIQLVESGKPTALALQKVLQENYLLQDVTKPSYEFLFTDAPEKVAKVAEKFLGGKLPGKTAKISL